MTYTFEDLDKDHKENWKQLEAVNNKSDWKFRASLKYEHFRSLISWDIITIVDENLKKIAELKLEIKKPTKIIPSNRFQKLKSWSLTLLKPVVNMLNNKIKLTVSETDIWILFNWDWIELKSENSEITIQLFINNIWLNVVINCLKKYYIPLLQREIWNHINVDDIAERTWIPYYEE